MALARDSANGVDHFRDAIVDSLRCGRSSERDGTPSTARRPAKTGFNDGTFILGESSFDLLTEADADQHQRHQHIST